VKNPTGQVEHEASTSKIGEEQLLYCRQRGIPEEEAVSMIVNGFCRDGAPCMRSRRSCTRPVCADPERGPQRDSAASHLSRPRCLPLLAVGGTLLLFVVFAIVFVLAAAAAFALPELRGKTLPE